MTEHEVLKLDASTVAWRELEGEVVALDLERSVYLSINRAGAILWLALLDGATRADLANRLIERFRIEEDAARRDVDAFVGMCEERGLIRR